MQKKEVSLFLKEQAIKEYGADNVLFKKSGYSHIPDNFYIGVIKDDGSYIERFVSDWDTNSNIDPIYKSEEENCNYNYFLGCGLKVQSKREAQFLFETGEIVSEGGIRNKMLCHLRGEFEITPDYFQWDWEWKHFQDLVAKYK